MARKKRSKKASSKKRVRSGGKKMPIVRKSKMVKKGK